MRVARGLVGLALNAEDTVETDGFSELFAEGVVLSQELRLPTNFFGKLGHQLFSAVWSSRDYASLQQSPLVILPNVPIARQSGSWALTYNFDQYLIVEPHDSEKGWGLFGRAGLADPDTNPIEFSSVWAWGATADCAVDAMIPLESAGITREPVRGSHLSSRPHWAPLGTAKVAKRSITSP